MGYRETYNTTPVPISAPALLDNLVNGELADNTYSIFSYKTNDAPSGVAVALFSRVRASAGGSITWHMFRWDGTTGEQISQGPVTGASGLYLHTTAIREFRDGNLYIWTNLLAVWLRFGTQPGGQVTDTLPLFKFSAYDDTDPFTAFYRDGGGPESFYDPISRLICSHVTSPDGNSQQGKVRTYDNDNPWTRIGETTHACGLAQSIFDIGNPYAVVVNRTGVAVTFNYLNNQIVHVTKHRPQLAGSVDTSRLYGYDRHNHRLLICDLQPQSGGVEQTYIRGFSPVPIVHHLQQPVAVREPRVNAVTKVFTKAIGSSGEGVAGVEVTFSDEGVGDVAPVTVVTDVDGWAEAFYDGLATGGAETITVSAVVPDDLFEPSEGSGGGYGPPVWTPEIDLDFNQFPTLPNLPVNTIIAEQVDWEQGTTQPRGCNSDVTILKIGKVRSCEIGIASGTTGTPDNPTDGTFGGDIVPTTSAQTLFGGQVWFGGWFYFPTGFDFSTTSNGLMLFRLGNDQTANYVTIKLKHSAGSTHTGYELTWPDETVTDARHNFTADSSGLISADTWHFFQFYSNNTDVGASAAQRFWIDGILLWELVDDQARHLETAGAGALVDFTANEAIPTATTGTNKFDELKVFNNWEGGAPASQVLYCQTVVWTLDPDDLLGVDSEGNTYIDTTQQENL